jgi:hypothetical protein
MVSAPTVTAGLAACVLMIGGVGAAAAGQADAGVDRQLRNGSAVWGSKAGVRNDAAARGRDRSKSARTSPGAAAPAAPAASAAAAPSRPGSGGGSSGSPSTGAAPAPAPPVSAAPVEPSGLSHDAPEAAPRIGVTGRSGSPGPSAAPTPEPSTLLMMGVGLVGLYRMRRRRS